MGKIKASYVTDKGKQMLFSGGTVNYTKAVLYSQDVSNLTVSDLRQLASLTGELMTTPVGVSDKQDGSTSSVNVEATFTNAGLDHDIEFHSVGWFAKQGDNGTETLMAVQVANNGANLAAGSPNGATDAVDLTLSFAIGDATTVTAVIDPAGSPTFTDLHNSANDIRSELHTALDTKADKSDLEPLAKSADVNKALDTKADKSQLPDLTPYAKSADVNAGLDTKADKQTVADDLAKKADQSDVTEKLATKADKDELASNVKKINDTINTKADQAGVDEALSKKADATALADYAKSADVNAELDKKADKTALDDYAKSSDVAEDVRQLNDSIATKADAKTVNDAIDKIDFTPYAKTADVNDALAGKANTTDLAPFAKSEDVSKQIEGVSTAVTNASNTEQADIDKINKALATKRDITDSYSKDELDKKFLQLSTDTGGKVDANQVATMIENKADKSDVTKQIGTVTDLVNTKANITDVDAALDKKDDTTDVDAKIKTVTDLANTKADASDTYNKKAVDDAFSQRDSRITNVTNLANQIDSTRLPLYQGSANEDLKGFFTPQIRMYNNATGVKNIPADCQYQSNFYGTLVVLPDGASNTNDGSQILITPERKAWISQSNGQGAKSWSDWSRFTLDSDLIALQNSLQSKIDTKANASDVYKKSEVDGKTSGIIITGYDIASETPTQENNDYTKRWLVDQGVLTQFAEQINQLKGRRTVNQPDFNALTDGGSYYITDPSNGKNSPTGSWGNLFVSNGNGHRISQLYFPDDGSALFMRELDETTWHGWIQFATVEQINTVNSTLNTKANTSDVNSALNTKANTSDVSALQNKVNVDDNLYSAPGSVTSWASLQADGSKNVLRSVRTEGTGTAFNTGNFDAGILFGGNDTKALISVGYTGNRAIVTGGNNQSVWHEDIAWKSDISNVNNQINSTNQTVSALQQTIKTLNDTLSNANATIKTLQDTITGLQTQVSNQANEISYIKANYIEGKRFAKADESQATAWEKENSQRIAFITDN